MLEKRTKNRPRKNQRGSRAHRHDGRIATALRIGTLALLMLAILSCSDSPDRHSPLDGNDAATPVMLVGGTVRDMDFAPVADAVVTLEPSTNGIPLAVQELMYDALGRKYDDGIAAAGAERRAAVTDANGRYRFVDVLEGEYLVQAVADDYLGGARMIDVPAAIAAVETIVVDVVLTPTGSFTGTALLENGATHEGSVVYVEGTSYAAITDPAGAYEISGVPVGSYTVRGMHPNYLQDAESGTITMAGEQVALATLNLLIDSNIPPVATVTGGPYGGLATAPIGFGGIGSDADGTVELFEWDFEGDGLFDYSSPTTAATTHAYPTHGDYTAKLRVTDDMGAIGLDVVTVTVDSIAPAIYVTTTGSNGNPGTITQPVATLSYAYSLAIAQTLDLVIMEAGTYSEVPQFLQGISVEGGYSYPDWNPDSGYSTFSVGSSRALANNISTTTRIYRVQINATNAPVGINSIALYSQSSNSSLVFDNCRFIAARGGNGTTPGSDGGNGAPGGSGGSGQNGSCDAGHGNGGFGGSSPGGCPGGSGGRGGVEGPNNGVSGSTGSCGGGSGGFRGAGGGDNCSVICTSCDPVGDGQNGNNGGVGSPGSHGSSGSPTGVAGSEWVPNTSTPGQQGASGRGGGGGGGGGGQGGTCQNDGGGNGGGGGGGGGQGGFRGTGGRGGYGSFAVYLYQSSPTFIGCYFEADQGGTGSIGGDGGVGGNGGNGGNGPNACSAEVGGGGDGGNGGKGGGGGGGGGGPGGPSYCVYRAGGSNPSVQTPQYNTGSGGAGGLGGLQGNVGPRAQTGFTGAVGTQGP